VWVAFAIFSVAILVIVALLQFVFLSFFNERMNMRQLRDVGDQISADIAADDTVGTLQEAYFTFGIPFRLMTESGVALWKCGDILSTGLSPGPPCQQEMPDRGMTEGFIELRSEVLAHGEPVVQMESRQIGDASLAIYFGPVDLTDGTRLYLYASRAVPEIDSTVAMLRGQFFIIAAIVLVGSLIGAHLISRRLTDPITGLNKTARRLAEGDLTVTFAGQGLTETDRLAETLNHATTHMRETERSRSDFVTNVTHDLKTPLTIIQSHAELIRDVSGDNPAKRTAHAQTIIDEATRMTGMVNEVLDLTRLESLAAEMTMRPVDLSELLKTALSSFSGLADNEGYVITTDIEAGLTVIGDEHYLNRVFYNLIGNAINYTGDNKWIGVRLRHLGSVVRFEVSDTGPGIPSDQLDGIWDRYATSPDTHRRGIVGSGIGLSIVRRVIERHHGRMGVVSEPGKGSTFWFDLALAPLPAPVASEAASESASVRN
jgi:signal transduction histidine kinase